METNESVLQKKSRNPIVIIVIIASMLVTILVNALSLLKGWSMIEYVGWEFEPLLHKEGVKESYDLVTSLLLGKMLVTIVATICIIFFSVMLLRWKKYGFWGVIITSVLDAIANIIVYVLVAKAFMKVDVNISYNPLVQVVWTVVTIALLFAALQIRKNGVSCWKQLE